jgi:release factor glutamine methyltransferase
MSGDDGLTVRAAWRVEAARLVAAGIEADEARLEAEVLLRHVLGIDRGTFLARVDFLLTGEAASRLDSLVRRRTGREPLAYIIGRREFYGLDFAVDPRVLIPRPETEGLVERAIARARQRAQGAAATIADVGTGSGCIAIALAVHLPLAQIFALDAASDALKVAVSNARLHGVDNRITFLCGDFLAPLQEKVDIIVSNPPYVSGGEIDALSPEIAVHEPRVALDGGVDGLDALRRLMGQAPWRLKRGGAMFVEIGDGQGSAAMLLARNAFCAATITVDSDLAGHERYLTIWT